MKFANLKKEAPPHHTTPHHTTPHHTTPHNTTQHKTTQLHAGQRSHNCYWGGDCLHAMRHRIYACPLYALNLEERSSPLSPPH